jgi:hypothetical protein
MKVFLGWSGPTSQQVAFALRDWLRKVIQSLTPYVSTEDVAKGAPWAASIAGELQASKFGVICVTRENLDSKWIHFEAGALSKEIGEARVSPFLFDLKPSDIEGPLTLFQATLNTRDDIFRLLSGMNKMNKREDGQPHLTEGELQEAFDTRWPALDVAFAQIRQAEGNKPALEKPDSGRMLEELLEIGRALQRQTAQRADDFHVLSELLESRLGNATLHITGTGSPILRPIASGSILAGAPGGAAQDALRDVAKVEVSTGLDSIARLGRAGAAKVEVSTGLDSFARLGRVGITNQGSSDSPIPHPTGCACLSCQLSRERT